MVKVSPLRAPRYGRAATISPLRVAAVDCCPCAAVAANDGGLVTPFDFAVLRYRWTSDAGTDLDTRTAVSSPARLRDVGWQRYVTDPGDDILPACQVSAAPPDVSAYYLVHGGDNCQAGVEAVLLNLKLLAQDNPSLDAMEIRFRAFWYSARASGDVTLEFQTFLGGAMQHQDYDFVNVGGAAQQTIQVSRNVHAGDGADGGAHANIDGFDLGTLVYDTAAKTAQILPP